MVVAEVTVHFFTVGIDQWVQATGLTSPQGHWETPQPAAGTALDGGVGGVEWYQSATKILVTIFFAD